MQILVEGYRELLETESLLVNGGGDYPGSNGLPPENTSTDSTGGSSSSSGGGSSSSGGCSGGGGGTSGTCSGGGGGTSGTCSGGGGSSSGGCSGALDPAGGTPASPGNCSVSSSYTTWDLTPQPGMTTQGTNNFYSTLVGLLGQDNNVLDAALNAAIPTAGDSLKAAGCMFESYLAAAQLYAGKDLSTDQIVAIVKDLRGSAISSGYMVTDSAAVLKDALSKLGITGTSVSVNDQAVGAVFTIQEVLSSNNNIHYILGNHSGSGSVWDPLSTDTSRLMVIRSQDHFIHIGN